MTSTTTDDLIALITFDMRQAMKNRQTIKLNELRSVLARISNAQAIGQEVSEASDTASIPDTVNGVGSTEAQRKILSVTDVKVILLAEIREISDVLVRIDNDSDYATELQAKIFIVKKYLDELS